MANYVNLMDIVYPVGSICQTMSSTSPSSTAGGTWTQIKTFLMGSDTAKTTGGEATHTLTINEMPKYDHEQFITANNGGTGLRKDYSSDSKDAQKYAQGVNTGLTGGASSQQLATVHHLFYLVSHCVNLQEVM